ncbi:MAG: hypothetical protein B6I36_11280 [Desulfobacteraceae bacterium 4572_35.1]|nr:MAG: hypothetical protein B6I36_11280 [Desulfobacteraceae bacterium 4572_35.1]
MPWGSGAFVPDNFIAKHLGSQNRSSIFKAALFGVPIPLCSCGVLPAAAGIRKQGASKGATTAFLISTPETGVDSIAVTWALLDPLMAILRPISAFLTAMVTGQLVQFFDPDTQAKVDTNSPSSITIPSSCCSNEVKSKKIATRIFDAMAYAYGDLFKDIAGWFFLGVGLAGLITVFVSPDLVEQWLGNPLIAMVVMLIAGVPLYVCATASTPIVAALVLKGLNPGAALVFLLVGPATNAAALSVIAKILGKKATGIYLGGIMASALLMGIAVDVIYSMTNLTAGWQAITHDEHRTLIGMVSALMLFVLVLLPKRKTKQPVENCQCSS